MRGRNTPVAVESHRADGTVRSRIEDGSGIAVPVRQPVHSLLFHNERVSLDGLRAELRRQRLRTRTDDEPLDASIEYSSREGHRISDRRHRRDGARHERRAVHDSRVELRNALVIQKRAVSGIERRIVLERANGRLDGIERRTPLLQELVREGGCRAAPVLVRRNKAIRNLPRAAVNGDGYSHDGSPAGRREVVGRSRGMLTAYVDPGSTTIEEIPSTSSSVEPIVRANSSHAWAVSGGRTSA